jgi:Mg-chelatase subunit ChlD
MYTGTTGGNKPPKQTEITLTANNNHCMKTSVKLDENYFLTTDVVNSTVAVPVAKQTNHIFVVDVSGSMSWELQKIRTQLKNKLSNIMKDGDTISIVWFSGSRDAGILKEEVEVKSLKTLSDLNDAIDRWLKPVGMTAFLKPLHLVKEIVGRVKKNRPNGVFSMIFLTDGYNNDCPWSEVTKALKDLQSDIDSSTFVEYGYYADTQKLTEMASILGGEKISCDGFDDYEVMFDAKMQKSVSGGKKIEVEITDKYLYDFAFSVSDGAVLLYNIVDNKILVGADVKEIHFFTPKAIGGDVPANADTLYAAIYVLSDKLMNDSAEKVFYALGDNFYYKMLANAFGKQKLNAFKTAIKECVADASKRFPSGSGAIQKVDDNAYCFMNLINDLGNLDGCLFYSNHPNFNYNRIGRKKVAVGSTITDADKKRLTEAKTMEELSSITKELEEAKVDIRFENANPDRGYPLTDLVWNEERANLSVRIYIEGTAILPKNKFGIENVTSFKYNTFTLVKDGIVNVTELPVSYSVELLNILKANGVKYEIYNAPKTDSRFDNTIVIDLTSLPIVNRGMVKAVSANALAKQEWELCKLQGDKKVYDYFRKSLFPKTSKSFVELLGQEATDWLKEIGITDFNGFAPKVTSAESTDFYMSVNLATKIKGLSSLPKVEDVIAKIKSGAVLKLNEWTMADAIKKYLAQTEGDMFQSLSKEQQDGMLKTYLETKSNILNKQKRKIMQEIAQIKFSLILSKKWFTEFASFDENKLSLTLDGQALEFTFDLSEKEEKI